MYTTEETQKKWINWKAPIQNKTMQQQQVKHYFNSKNMKTYLHWLIEMFKWNIINRKKSVG